MVKTADKVLVIDKMFSKGFLRDKGSNKVPNYFATDIWNLRIKNGGITQRLGYQQIFDGASPHAVRGIVNNNGGRLYACQNSHLREILYNNSPVTNTDIGSIGTDNRCRFITYGIYTIILTGAGFPWVYDGTSLTQLTNTNIPTGTNPTFGTTFAGFTVVNSSLNPNILLVSVPITTAAQQNSYDWSGTGSQTLTFQSPVLGVIGTLDNLWVFTEKTIQRMDKSNLSNTGGISGLYTTPFASGYQLASPDSLVAAGDVIFFLTKNNKIGTVNFKVQVTQPQMEIISNVFGNSIDEFMQNSLDADQSDSFAIFDRKYNIVKFYCQSTDSTVNDITVIRDMQNQTWLKDNNKFMSCATILHDEIYTGSAFSYKIYQDEIGGDDNGEGIEWIYDSAQMIIGGPADVKQYRGAQIAGQLNNVTKIRRRILIDDNVVFDKVIDGANIAPIFLGFGIGGDPIGGEPIGGDVLSMLSDLVAFERVIDTGSLRNVGKRIEMIFSGSELGQNFILDYLNVVVRPRVRKMVTDMM